MESAARQDVRSGGHMSYESDAIIEIIDDEEEECGGPLLPRAIPQTPSPRLPLLMGALVITAAIGAGLALLT